MKFMPLYLLFLFLLWPAGVHAQGRKPMHLQNPFVEETGLHFAFHSVEDDHGGFFLVWPHAEGGQLTLLAQHIDAQGNSATTAAGRPLTSLQDAETPHWDATADSKGGLLLVWEDQDHVQVQRFSTDLHPVWTGKQTFVSTSTFAQQFPALSADGGGGAYVVWQEKRYDNRWVLMSQHFSELGLRRWPADGLRVSLRPSEQKTPTVVYDGSAGAIIAWQDFRESASQLQTQRLDYQGNRMWGLEGVLITAPVDKTKPPYVGAVGSGSAVLAWQASASSANRIFLQRVNRTGVLAWTQGIELTNGNWHEWNPVLHGDGEGGTWIAWEDFRNALNWQVYVQHLTLNGKPAWPQGEVALAVVPADQGHLGLSDDGRGGVLAAWTDNRFGTNTVYMQEINPQGKALFGAAGFVIADGLKNPQAPQIISLAPGQAIICWADATSKAHWALYWKRLDRVDPSSIKS